MESYNPARREHSLQTSVDYYRLIERCAKFGEVNRLPIRKLKRFLKPSLVDRINDKLETKGKDVNNVQEFLDVAHKLTYQGCPWKREASKEPHSGRDLHTRRKDRTKDNSKSSFRDSSRERTPSS
eukprot:Nk52_evm3s172 gene=Nk52_evmTU3s172